MTEQEAKQNDPLIQEALDAVNDFQWGYYHPNKTGDEKRRITATIKAVLKAAHSKNHGITSFDDVKVVLHVGCELQGVPK